LRRLGCLCSHSEPASIRMKRPGEVRSGEFFWVRSGDYRPERERISNRPLLLADPP
jgi:hypothetical protein